MFAEGKVMHCASGKGIWMKNDKTKNILINTDGKGQVEKHRENWKHL